jgi:hypothetical protein
MLQLKEIKELQVEQLSVHSNESLGCIRHKKELMISIVSEGIAYDIFLTEELRNKLTKGLWEIAKASL